MATRKQLKRERKRRTHGIERAEPSHRVVEATERPKAAGGGRRSRRASAQSSSARGRKPVAYPTLRRALRRAPLLAGVWFILIEFVFKPAGSTTVGNLGVTALIAGIMVPAMYLTDRFAYRLAVRRGAPVEPPPGAPAK